MLRLTWWPEAWLCPSWPDPLVCPRAGYGREGNPWDIGNDGGRWSSLCNFKRTCFGVLSHKQKHSKAGYTCAVDFLRIDETTFEGAAVMAELIGIQGFMMGGNGACRVIVTNDYGEGLGTAKTFRYNASSINDRGTDYF